MEVEKEFITDEAKELLSKDKLIQQAYNEVKTSICSPIWPATSKTFTINNTEKNCNGVVPIKELCYTLLEDTYNWYREKPLDILKLEKKKGGPIDVYKEFIENSELKRVGMEFETGNISSAHRSMNKLLLGLKHGEIDLAIILMPIKQLAYYLTDRVTNFEELEPYFELTEGQPFIFIGFNAEAYNSNVPLIPKGSDGMSKRSIKKWKDKVENK
ncbi:MULTISPECIES: type-2 restriction enzyme BamHI [Bacillus]|uniref:Type II restriction enzyme BamHI n=3 Tax=Bacillus amyloliquefaciens TaxID=1390 RepID=T2BA_BACAM|nr:type-2 restriction enzyme BamHI [Bacillus amyloliquefaciens]P23940.1 RecName: Full=Type II restriction enzyme BamHI; Short=R.BamHI; AltName: Full=Endonuclease BamHI; AltName: Full=Type-2 restriction enzyme BamHI [Bacillus amyloliquefaciens]1BAM_A Chain A, ENDONUCLEASE BamH I [Bacillus amyloliquefaciens]1BHM_A Chain A, PROTEIN (BAMHI (E.C.3.1.21.4)) [Bacillus amyloliquefaciens]1BHM_B Chain B, PROTEIN (BAMHI (E.C.3.1.21.4)) [Bacillus amyloliquefaciens]1ESG_A Chain A, TYPE II RESTRICTION ENZYM